MLRYHNVHVFVSSKNFISSKIFVETRSSWLHEAKYYSYFVLFNFLIQFVVANFSGGICTTTT
jgi:hypothetical protein